MGYSFDLYFFKAFGSSPVPQSKWYPLGQKFEFSDSENSDNGINVQNLYETIAKAVDIEIQNTFNLTSTQMQGKLDRIEVASAKSLKKIFSFNQDKIYKDFINASAKLQKEQIQGGQRAISSRKFFKNYRALNILHDNFKNKASIIFAELSQKTDEKKSKLTKSTVEPITAFKDLIGVAERLSSPGFTKNQMYKKILNAGLKDTASVNISKLQGEIVEYATALGFASFDTLTGKVKKGLSVQKVFMSGYNTKADLWVFMDLDGFDINFGVTVKSKVSEDRTFTALKGNLQPVFDQLKAQYPDFFSKIQTYVTQNKSNKYLQRDLLNLQKYMLMLMSDVIYGGDNNLPISEHALLKERALLLVAFKPDPSNFGNLHAKATFLNKFLREQPFLSMESKEKAGFPIDFYKPGAKLEGDRFLSDFGLSDRMAREVSKNKSGGNQQGGNNP